MSLTGDLRKSAWALNPLCLLRWRRWDDDWVVFDAGSGSTHQMDALAAVTLMCLEAGPSELATLREQVAAELDLSAGEEFSRALRGVVERLHALGLIEPVTQ